METLYEEVLGHLKREDKEKALILCLESLENNHITVIELYESILRPALNSIIDDFKNDEDLIWKEHVRSGIIRTIIESAHSLLAVLLGITHDKKIAERADRIIEIKDGRIEMDIRK